MNKVYTLIGLILVLGGLYFVWPSAIKAPAQIENNTPVITQVDATTTGSVATSTEVVATSTVKVTSSTPVINKIIKNRMNTITLDTNKGKIVFQTYDADAPKASANFVTLANKGFYNGVIFHRVIKGFMIQGGDPTGTGRGGPGYKFADELDPNTASAKEGYTRGTVAMANSGPDTNGSQFFIMHADYPLPHNYTIFGKVISGLDVVDSIANSATDPLDKPLQDIVINKVTVNPSK